MNVEQFLEIVNAPRCEVCKHALPIRKAMADQEAKFRCNIIKDWVDSLHACEEFVCDLVKANMSHTAYRLQYLQDNKEPH